MHNIPHIPLLGARPPSHFFGALLGAVLT